MHNAINWFEIPAADFERAVTFYQSILAAPIRTETIDGIPNGILPYDRPGVGGSIVADPQNQPSSGGTLAYLNAAGQLQAILERVERAGGQVLVPETPIGPIGSIAVIRDSEGNRIGLHQPPA
jgi:predicted enzyme related to lactoylglutathione lyase